MARLIVAMGGTERTLELEPGKALSVGREASNDVPMPDERQASRRHCEVRSLPTGGWEVVDLGATNKTRVNGVPTDRRALATGDVIEVGKVSLRYEDPQEEERLQQAGKQGVCLLEWSDGPKKGQRVMLVGPRTTLGRRESNTIPLDDRMASGHHAEIVKDLNGYTIRDLGSTNGILVNGGPTTESPLTHGTRLRVGNSRFVFKDPAMKDVEVELNRLEDDDGWGMMGDIDLTRARTSKAGTLSLLGVLALVGAGGWYMWKEGEKAGQASGASSTVGEQIVNGTFESAEMPWSYDEGAGVRVERRGSAGASALQAAYGEREHGKPEWVAYENEFAVTDGRTLRLKARLKGSGDLVALWHLEADRAKGITGVTRAVVLGSGGGGSVDRTLSFPSWATTLRLALRLEPGQSVTLDDLSVKAVPETPPTIVCDCPGLPEGQVEADGSLSIAINRTVLAVGGGAVAWKGEARLAFEPGGPARKADLTARIEGTFRGSGIELPGSVAWTAGEEGLQAVVECAGADRCGLVLDLPRTHVGPSLNLLTAADARTVPSTVGPVAPDARLTLAGSPEPVPPRPATLLGVAPREGTAALSVEDSGDPSTLRLLHVAAGAQASFTVLTDFTQQKQAASAALAAAKAQVRTAPGAAVRALRQVVVQYPFVAQVAEEAGRTAAELEARAAKDVADLKTSIAAFRILGSQGALEDLEQRLRTLRAAFLAGSEAPAEASLEADIAAHAAIADGLIAAHHLERALPDVDRLEGVGDLLSTSPGYEAMGALVFRNLTEGYGRFTAAGGALADRFQHWKARLDELVQRPDVKAALPPR